MDNKTEIKLKLGEISRLCEENGVPSSILDRLDDLQKTLGLSETDSGLDLSVQLSLYPLRQKDLSPIINESLQILQDLGLQVKPGTMSTLILGKEDLLWTGLRKAFKSATARGEAVMIATISNACPKPTD